MLRFYLVVFSTIFSFHSLEASISLPKRDQVLDRARYMLENWTISYVLGGGKIGSSQECDRCNACLAQKSPDKSQRLLLCPVCNSCSLDCSHFTFEVFKQAGLPSRYLTTEMMRELGPDTLLRQYHLVDIGDRLPRAMPGDLLVYPGHVVMLEKKYPDGRADVIHVTSGKDLRGPGLGIQRERHVSLAEFRGPLQRILRHSELVEELKSVYLQREGAGSRPRGGQGFDSERN